MMFKAFVSMFTTMFIGLMSWCITPAECTACSPCTARSVRRRAEELEENERKKVLIVREVRGQGGRKNHRKGEHIHTNSTCNFYECLNGKALARNE